MNKTIQKWVKKWAEEKVFESNPDNRKKFFLTFPYPYINLYPHIGHFYSLMRVEAFARYKRMRGYNVLYPQGWHCTGSPMVNAAQRIKEGEEKQIGILKKMGFPDSEIKEFEEPKHWIDVFSKGWQDDLTNAGVSIDWRRNFITTSLNPHYNKFIEWQFRKLKEKGYVVKGKKPVIWCEKCNQAIGDHARVKGEGETPQEFCLFKFKLDDGRYIMTATLRPDTVMGITNVYVNPDETYAEIKVKDEIWIVGKPIIDKLRLQEFEPEIIKDVKGIEFIGKWVESFGGKQIPVLPASFLSTDYGTGMVHSVPSDSADDLIALRDLQKDEKTLKKYNLDNQKIKDLKPIEIFDTPGVNGTTADHYLKKYNVTSQDQRDKLEKIKKELYKFTFNQSSFNELYKDVFSKDLQGVLVKDAQQMIKDELHSKGTIEYFYEATGEVICRCLNVAKVKIVSNQWFLAYGNLEWKKLAHECLDQMTLYPKKAYAQFNYVLDWLNDWACTHESKSELGTQLPWDKEWVIESLSDSTIYMAYYTIAHKIKDMDANKIDDRFFDYVFLGHGDKKDIGIDEDVLDDLRDEFNYWYPMDLRGSGKDLIQNHLSFSIFNHTAIFPKKHWPQGFGVNGWVTVDGNKMSKSLGNVIPVREMISQFGPDASRFTVLCGGEGLEDANWETELAKSMKDKLKQLEEFSISNHGKGTEEIRTIDKWLDSQVNSIVQEVTGCMEILKFRSALQKSYFDLQRVFKWYNKRCAGQPNKTSMSAAIKTQILLLAPFTPFTCEEVWEKIGEKGFISTADWPNADMKKIDENLNLIEDMIRTTVDDMNSVIKLAKLDKPKKFRLFVADSWKYNLLVLVLSELEKSRNFGDIMKTVMQNAEFKPHSKLVSKIIQRALKTGLENPGKRNIEFEVLCESKVFFETEFGCNVEIIKEEESKEAKSAQAMPGKPAILVE